MPTLTIQIKKSKEIEAMKEHNRKEILGFIVDKLQHSTYNDLLQVRVLINTMEVNSLWEGIRNGG